MTEQQRAVTDCTQQDASPKTTTPPGPTRRELRAARVALDLVTAAQHDGPVDAGSVDVRPATVHDRPVSRRSLRTASPAPTTPPRGRTPGLPVRLGRAAAALTLTGALAVSGFALQRADSAEARAAALGAAVRSQIARSSTAESTRLTTQATAFAQGLEAEAQRAAAVALARTDTVVQTAAPVLDADTLTPLQNAAAALEALLESGAGSAPPSIPGVEATAAEGPGTVASPSPQDAVRAAAVSRASRSTAERRAALSDPAASEGPAPAHEVAGDADVENPTAPDLATSAQMLEMAAQVTALSTELQATVDMKVAAAQAQALAEAAASAETAHKVALASTADNGEIPTDALCAPSFAPLELLRCDAAQALEHLNAAYRANFGRDLEIVSSYRSYREQISTRRSRGWLAAAPGTSNHGLALAVDFGSFGGLGNFSTPSYRWMKNHAGDHGWSHPSLMERGGGGPQEPWHWEFGTS